MKNWKILFEDNALPRWEGVGQVRRKLAPSFIAYRCVTHSKTLMCIIRSRTPFDPLTITTPEVPDRPSRGTSDPLWRPLVYSDPSWKTNSQAGISEHQLSLSWKSVSERGKLCHFWFLHKILTSKNFSYKQMDFMHSDFKWPSPRYEFIARKWWAHTGLRLELHSLNAHNSYLIPHSSQRAYFRSRNYSHGQYARSLRPAHGQKKL